MPQVPQAPPVPQAPQVPPVPQVPPAQAPPVREAPCAPQAPQAPQGRRCRKCRRFLGAAPAILKDAIAHHPDATGRCTAAPRPQVPALPQEAARPPGAAARHTGAEVRRPGAAPSYNRHRPSLTSAARDPQALQVETMPPPVVLQHPFTMMIAAPTGSGKSTWVKELLIRRNTMIPLLLRESCGFIDDGSLILS